MSEKIQISFTQDQKRQLNEEKERLGSSIGSIVRLAVMKYFESEEAKHEY